MSWLAASVIILAMLVAILAVAVFALARQVGVLYERIAPAGALMLASALEVGAQAPAVPVTTIDGQEKALGLPAAQGSQLLFFLSPQCPICKTLLPVLDSLNRHEADTEIILISDGDDLEEHRRFVRHHELQRYPYVVSESAGRTYGVAKLPYAVLVDQQHQVAAAGVVNSREHIESLFEARRLGVSSIQQYFQQAGVGEELGHDILPADQTGGSQAGRTQASGAQG